MNGNGAVADDETEVASLCRLLVLGAVAEKSYGGKWTEKCQRQV